MATWTQSTITAGNTKILSTDSGQGESWGIKVAASEPVSGQSITSCKIGFERLSGSATDLVYCGIWNDQTSFDTGNVPDHTLWTMRMVDIITGLNQGTVTPGTIPVDGYIGVNVQTLTGTDLKVQAANPAPAGYPVMREKQSGGSGSDNVRTLVWEMSSGAVSSGILLPPPVAWI
jgi:hypothetical protein